MAEFAIRAARPDDNDALIALERRSPLIVGDTELSFDRAPDYFAGTRLQERSLLAVAVANGRPVGVSASALHTTTLAGKRQLLSYTHHMRVDPAFQRSGVGRALGRWLRARWGGWGLAPERGYSFIDAANADSLAFAGSGGGPGPWPIDGWLHDLPAAPGTRDGTVGIDRDDLAAIVRLLNATHEGLELFPVYTADSLAKRLHRSPHYSLRDWRAVLRVGEIVAVAGVLDQGAAVASLARDRRTGETHETRSLTVLDFGFSDLGAMHDLLEALRAEAAARGRQALTISVPECSPLYEAVAGWASHTTRFKFLAGFHPPAGYPLRGIYIDPVYL